MYSFFFLSFSSSRLQISRVGVGNASCSVAIKVFGMKLCASCMKLFESLDWEMFISSKLCLIARVTSLYVLVYGFSCIKCVFKYACFEGYLKFWLSHSGYHKSILLSSKEHSQKEYWAKIDINSRYSTWFSLSTKQNDWLLWTTILEYSKAK